MLLAAPPRQYTCPVICPEGCTWNSQPRIRLLSVIPAQVDDLIVVDGGMVSLEVVSKAGPDVVARVVDPGIILSRANLTFQRNGTIVRARNAMLPVLSSKVRRRKRPNPKPCPAPSHRPDRTAKSVQRVLDCIFLRFDAFCAKTVFAR